MGVGEQGPIHFKNHFGNLQFTGVTYSHTDLLVQSMVNLLKGYSVSIIDAQHSIST